MCSISDDHVSSSPTNQQLASMRMLNHTHISSSSWSPFINPFRRLSYSVMLVIRFTTKSKRFSFFPLLIPQLPKTCMWQMDMINYIKPFSYC